MSETKDVDPGPAYEPFTNYGRYDTAPGSIIQWHLITEKSSLRLLGKVRCRMTIERFKHNGLMDPYQETMECLF